MEKIKKNKVLRAILFCVLSFLAGGVNGFLGTGGGIIFVYMLEMLTDNDKKDSFATTLCATIPISVISAIEYGKNGNIDTDMLRMLFLPAIAGGALGALLTDRLKTRFLTVAFSGLVVYSGICMVMK